MTSIRSTATPQHARWPGRWSSEDAEESTAVPSNESMSLSVPQLRYVYVWKIKGQVEDKRDEVRISGISATRRGYEGRRGEESNSQQVASKLLYRETKGVLPSLLLCRGWTGTPTSRTLTKGQLSNIHTRSPVSCLCTISFERHDRTTISLVEIDGAKHARKSGPRTQPARIHKRRICRGGSVSRLFALASLRLGVPPRP